MTSRVQANERFHDLGTVIDVARYPLEAFARHEVPVQAMRDFAQRARRHSNPAQDADDSFVTIDPDVDVGGRILHPDTITLQELFGSGYDVETDEIRLFEYHGSTSATLTMEGLAHALLGPPYGLRSTGRPLRAHLESPSRVEIHQAWLRETLRDFCAEVLALEDPRHAEHLTIHRWPTDWSTYFDAGKEWWGCFCWSIEDHRHQWVTVLAASTTD